jgi:hypothetical protein
MTKIVEYAGFRYEAFGDGPETCRLLPVPEQHHAAGRERNVRAATEQYLEDMKRGEKLK